MDYGLLLWGSTSPSLKRKVFLLQKKAIRIVCGAKYNDNTDPLFFQHKVLKLEDLYTFQISKHMFLHSKMLLPTPLSNMFVMNRDIHTYDTRQRNLPHILPRRTRVAANSLRHKGPEVWYRVPQHIKDAASIITFKTQLKKYLFSNQE